MSQTKGGKTADFCFEPPGALDDFYLSRSTVKYNEKQFRNQ